MTRDTNRWSVLFLVILFGFLTIGILLPKIMDAEKPSIWIHVFYGVIIFGVPIGNLVLIFWFLKHQPRKFGLQCPSCSKPLTGITGQIAVATGFCGHCGERVVCDGVHSN